MPDSKSPGSGGPLPWQRDFLSRHRLGAGYLASAQKWFAPLALALMAHQKEASGFLLVGINGCQGSGKSTLADYLASYLRNNPGESVLALSLDDFYLPRAARENLARDVHPLFRTRGVPGTHDMSLLLETLDRLADPASFPVDIVRFDKARDDRRRRDEWDQAGQPPTIVLLEGWCLGASPQSTEQLAAPLNALEEQDDADGAWRRAVNDYLARDFPPLYRRVGKWVMLQAPSFDCVYRWRLEQEQKLAASATGEAIMDEARIARFIQHYQRLTENCLSTLPDSVDYLYQLDEARRIRACRGLEA